MHISPCNYHSNTTEVAEYNKGRWTMSLNYRNARIIWIKQAKLIIILIIVYNTQNIHNYIFIYTYIYIFKTNTILLIVPALSRMLLPYSCGQYAIERSCRELWSVRPQEQHLFPCSEPVIRCYTCLTIFRLHYKFYAGWWLVFFSILISLSLLVPSSIAGNEIRCYTRSWVASCSDVGSL